MNEEGQKTTDNKPEGADLQPDDVTEDLQSEASKLEALNAELEKARNDLLYLRADFENYKKQAMKERADLLKYGAERVIGSLLDVLDNFGRALETQIDPKNKQSLDGFKKGMELTAAEFRATLKKFGVEEVESKGQPFDPNVHEALGSEETDQFKPGYVSQVFKPAYKLHDRIIRPAQVIIAKEKS